MKKLIFLIAFLAAGYFGSAQTYYTGRDLVFKNSVGNLGLNYLTVYNSTGKWLLVFVEVEGTNNYNWFMISNYQELFLIENCHHRRVHFIEKMYLPITNPPSWITVNQGFFNVN